ncbi:MAG: sugar transferase [Candidatus Omnitrophota bacterium]
MVISKRSKDTYLFIKRVLDVSFAIILIGLTSPVLAVTAIVIKLTSKGPVIFRQIRLGRDKKPFSFYKFRSMYSGSSPEIHRQYIEKLMSETEKKIGRAGGVHKLTDDPRITMVGRIIRKTSIDELPQLFNVLKGDMSIVGPRPVIPYELKYYTTDMLERFCAKPGITGLWQVSKRYAVGYKEMVAIDILYARNWSIWLDLKILVRTFPAVLKVSKTY